MALKLIEAATEYPITLAEAKAFMSVEHSDHDGRITLLIAGETAYAEELTGRALCPQTWDYFADAFPGEAGPQHIEIPLAKVIRVDGVFYLDADGSEQEIDAADYVADVDSTRARIALAPNGTWPTTYEGLNAVRVRLVAGYADAGSSPLTADVLADIKLALLFRVRADYVAGDDAELFRKTADIYLIRHRVHLGLG